MISLLFAYQNHPDHRPMPVDDTLRDLQEEARRQGATLQALPDLRLGDLGPALAQHRPAALVIHTHGLPSGRLCLRAPPTSDGPPSGYRDVSPAHLVQSLVEAGPPPLVVLAACHSAPLAAALAAAGVPAIGAHDTVTAAALQAFLRAFFARRWAGGTVQASFAAGQAAAAPWAEGEEDRLILYDRPTVSALAAVDPIPAAARRARVLSLDLDGTPDRLAVEARLDPAHPAVDWSALRDFGAPAIDRFRQPDPLAHPWGRIGAAVDALAAAAQAACAQSPTHLYVVGNAPLSVFVHLGFALSGWARPLTLLNARRATCQWDVLHLDGPKPGPAFFSRVSGLAAPQEAEGRLDLYISCFGDAAPAAVTQRRAGGPRAGLVTLSTQAEQLLDADNVGRVAAELAHHLMRVTTCWPQSQGRGLFLRGPAPLAFLVGRAMNPRLHGPLTLFEYSGAAYTPVMTVPRAFSTTESGK